MSHCFLELHVYTMYMYLSESAENNHNAKFHNINNDDNEDDNNDEIAILAIFSKHQNERS